jgi:hypothetical protein
VPGSGEGEEDEGIESNSTYFSPSTAGSKGGGRSRPTTTSTSLSMLSTSSVPKDKLQRLQSLFTHKIQTTYNNSIKDAFKDADANCSGFIELEEFVSFVLDKLQLPAGHLSVF